MNLTFKGLYCDKCGRLITPEEGVFEIKYNDILCEKCYDELKKNIKEKI